jgi:hypothetical protein
MCGSSLTLCLANAVILGSESRRTQSHILLSQIWGSYNLEGQFRIYIPHEQGGQLYSLYPPGIGYSHIALFNHWDNTAMNKTL